MGERGKKQEKKGQKRKSGHKLIRLVGHLGRHKKKKKKNSEEELFFLHLRTP